MNTILKNIGANIRAMRKIRGLTIDQLAKRAGLSEKYLQGVEVGKRNISVTNLNKVAESLQTNIDKLVRMQCELVEHKSDKIVTISDRLKQFEPGQLDLINNMIEHIDTIVYKKE